MQNNFLDNSLKSLNLKNSPIFDKEEHAKYVKDWREQYVGQAVAVLRPVNTKEVSSILKFAHKNKIDVVADQTGAPTYAIDLAQFILNAILQKFDFKGTEIYHFTNAGITTWELSLIHI